MIIIKSLPIFFAVEFPSTTERMLTEEMLTEEMLTEEILTEEMLLLPVTGKSSFPSVISGGVAIVIIVLLAMGVALAIILRFL